MSLGVFHNRTEIVEFNKWVTDNAELFWKIYRDYRSDIKYNILKSLKKSKKNLPASVYEFSWVSYFTDMGYEKMRAKYPKIPRIVLDYIDSLPLYLQTKTGAQFKESMASVLKRESRLYLASPTLYKKTKKKATYDRYYAVYFYELNESINRLINAL